MNGLFRNSSRAFKMIQSMLISATSVCNTGQNYGKNSCQCIGNENVWYATTGAPQVDNDSNADTYPIKKGDFAIDLANGDAYICTVGVVSGVTNSTLVKIGG